MAEMTMPITGGCLCGAVRYEVSEPPFRVGYCHCGMCKRAFGGPFALFVDFRKQAVRFTKGAPTLYQSSSWGERGFCSNCGTPLLFRYREGTPVGESRLSADPYPEVRRSELIGFGLGSLDKPEDFRPSEHGFADSQIPWLVIDDGLPRNHGAFVDEAEAAEKAPTAD